jgi:hypothetical protein
VTATAAVDPRAPPQIIQRQPTRDAKECSELATACLETAGICPPLYSPVNKIEPVTLAIVCSALGAIVTS